MIGLLGGRDRHVSRRVSGSAVLRCRTGTHRGERIDNTVSDNGIPAGRRPVRGVFDARHDLPGSQFG